MNDMEIIGGSENDGLEYGPVLEDVDMELLVGTGFTKDSSRGIPRDLDPRQLHDEDLEGASGFMPANNFLSMDILGDLSPRNISDERELPLEKEYHFPFFVDNREIQDPCRTQNESIPQPVVLMDHTNSASMMVGAQSLALAHVAPLPETALLSDEITQLGGTPFATQNDWQDVATIALSASPQSVPSSGTIPVRMLHLESHNQPIMQPNAVLETNVCSASTAIDVGRRLLKVDSVPMKTSRKKREKAKESLVHNAIESLECRQNYATTAKAPKKKSGGRRKAGAHAHLSVEERKRLRAERNRESAEKSRMRRKQMVLELETNVAFLREENRDLKAKVEHYHGQLTSASEEVTKRAAESGVGSHEAMLKIPMLYEALSALQRCMEQCPRTFNRDPHMPVIPLKIPPAGRR